MTNEFEREKLLAPLTWLIYGMWLIIVVVILVMFFIRGFSLTIFPQTLEYMIIVLLLTGASNIINSLFFLKRHQLPTSTLRILLTLNVLLVQFFLTIAVSITGGIESVAVHLFHFITFFTITAFSARAVVLFALGSDLWLLLLYTLEHLHILPHFPRYTEATLGVYGNAEATVLNAIATVLWITAVAVFGAFIGAMIRRREEQIFSERHRIDSIIHDLPDGIILLDPSNRLLFMNPAAEAIVGVRTQDVLQHSFDPHENPEPALQRLHTLLFTPAQQKYTELHVSALPSFEYVLGEKNRERSFEVTPLPVQDLYGEFIGKMIIIHDITREKLVDKLKSEFISVAAHQLRTPLTAVKWALQMVRDGEIGSLNDEQYEMLEKGFVSNQRMVNLVNDLLDASRIEEGRFQYELKKISIEEMIQNLLPEFDHIIQEQKLQLSVNIPPTKLPYVYGDESKLRMVFQNLIDNAIRYTHPAGKIAIRINYSPEIGMIAFGIQDSGVGI